MKQAQINTWQFDGANGKVVDAKGKTIAIVPTKYLTDSYAEYEEGGIEAGLMIAAAPDMLEALKFTLENSALVGILKTKIESAILKAIGKTKF